MPTTLQPQLLDLAPPGADFRAAVCDGLRRTPKQLPCKFFYDVAGAQLFEQICAQPEYYLTRTELGILEQHAPAIASTLGRGTLLVELGSGSSHKTRILLDAIAAPAGYVPIDISRAQLLETACRLSTVYPDLPIYAVCADYTRDFSLPDHRRPGQRVCLFFPGSTIGNLTPAEARLFLGRLRRLGGAGSGLLIGVDLKKDPHVLHAAYNDAAGVTAAFNRNLLVRINRELAGSFAPDRFAHYAHYNVALGCIEMYLVSHGAQIVRAAGEEFAFESGEGISTESSYKYTLGSFAQLAAAAGYQLRQIWRDARHWFSVQYFVAVG